MANGNQQSSVQDQKLQLWKDGQLDTEALQKAWLEKCRINPQKLKLLADVKEYVHNFQTKFVDPVTELRNNILGDATQALQKMEKEVQEIQDFLVNLPGAVTKEIEKRLKEKIEEEMKNKPELQKFVKGISNLRKVLTLISQADAVVVTVLSTVNACLQQMKGEFKDWTTKPVETKTETEISTAVQKSLQKQDTRLVK